MIASRIGGIPETVRHEVNGLLFEPGDAADLARQIRRLIDEPGLLDRLRAGCDVPRTLDDDVGRNARPVSGPVRRSTTARGRSSTAPAGAIRVGRRGGAQLPHAGPDGGGRRDAAALEDATDAAHRGGQRRRRRLRRGARAGSAATSRFVATGGNLGFSGGCNAASATRWLGGRAAVLLVNSDVIVPPDCVTLAGGALGRQARPGIVAPVVRSRVWPDHVLSAGIDYDTGTGRMRQRLESRRRRDDVGAVSGCAMLVHRSVFDRIGLLPGGVLLLVRGHRVLSARARRGIRRRARTSRDRVPRRQRHDGREPEAAVLRGAQSPAARRRDTGAIVMASLSATVRHRRPTISRTPMTARGGATAPRACSR